MNRWREIDYTDTLLSDGSAHRRFSDGREEWRQRTAAVFVQWRDSQGAAGTDEALGTKFVKRTYRTGRSIYGRELGYGRTAWSDGTLTRNRTSFGGRMGMLLAAVGAGALLGGIIAPTDSMSMAEEEELRRQAQQQSSQSSGDGGDGGSDWSDDSDGGDSDDFG